ncbi:hypothetical protein PhaeoP83_03635 [Phaeobacter inhibens]|uniref:Uncharacterized protein n=1 Tax=Phaeobacter inhibens TaxID=221822 RepID=A0A2I7K1H0_9RHOB|nr:hypothetical protein PhaeoP83_03635 [Phaeobacter inhibens]AUQ96461.1 hypothetical protein PhaeoP66_03731 [Phaeobacter inhibens]AUR00973.1 hypothetical protein PhaeoP88_03657 [Phaeobacter inhibens]AUR21662.1 hypothetical protein PhaeoP80_03635 [Phaeobacter inhibens]
MGKIGGLLPKQKPPEHSGSKGSSACVQFCTDVLSNHEFGMQRTGRLQALEDINHIPR